MTISSITDLQATLGLDPNATAAAKDNQTLGQDDFLKLMITQFRNQDPFKPLESGEFLSQLAQFSTVAGVKDLQSSFKDMSASMVSNQALQASSLLGRSVLVNRSSGVLAVGGSLSGAVDVPASASSVVVNIQDANGQLVRQLSLGAHAKGLADYAWDGKLADGAAAPAGVYSVGAQLMVNGRTQSAASVLVTARVESVTIGADQSGLTLTLDGLGDIAFSDVRQIK
ncbi:MAG TPA: flagellar hook assembly protein FlgD [Steroidobacteraceae bacterium]|nr:flagellar hook assembly protein FlgD [Steroidobacteraceae bacterium]